YTPCTACTGSYLLSLLAALPFLARLVPDAHRRHLLRDPLHPRRGRHHVDVPARAEHLHHLARDRLLRVARDRPNTAIRGTAGQTARLRHGLGGDRGVEVPHHVHPRHAELDRAGHHHLHGRPRGGDHRRGDAVVPRRRTAGERLHVVGQRH